MTAKRLYSLFLRFARLLRFRLANRTGMFASALFVAMLVSGTSDSHAAEPAEGPKQENREESAVAYDVEGRSIVGGLAAIDENGVTLVDKAMQQTRLERRNLISLRFPTRGFSAAGPRSMVFLDNGDRFAVSPQTLKEETLAAKWLSFQGAPPLAIPIETVRGMFLNVPEIAEVQRRARLELLDRTEASDLLLLQNDDRMTGELKGIDQEFVTLQNGTGEVRVERGRIRWIGCNRELISFPTGPEPAAILTLTDGSRITIRAIKLDEAGMLSIDAAYGGAIQLPISSLTSILFLGDSKSYLSDRKEVEYQFTPFLSTMWQLRKDRAVDGGPLQIRGVEYMKGLGLHSQSRVRYRLDAGDRRFRAVVGIDDSANGEGSVKFAVELDGRKVFESAELTGKDPAVFVGPIDVTGAQELTLVVEFGEQADVLDRADWCEAVLIR